MNLSVVKARRCARKALPCWWEALKVPVASNGQLFQALVGYLVLVLLLRTATPGQRDILAGDWAIWVQAFGLAILGWIVVTLIWSPYAAHLADKKLGKWHGHHFIYHQPLLVATERFEDNGGRTQRRKVSFADAEPKAFVYYIIELTPKATGRVGVYVTGGTPPADADIGEGWITPSGAQHIGIRLPRDRRATMLARLQPDTVPVICRVWCHSFFVGRDDQSIK